MENVAARKAVRVADETVSQLESHDWLQALQNSFDIYHAITAYYLTSIVSYFWG